MLFNVRGSGPSREGLCPSGPKWPCLQRRAADRNPGGLRYSLRLGVDRADLEGGLRTGAASPHRKGSSYLRTGFIWTILAEQLQ